MSSQILGTTESLPIEQLTTYHKNPRQGDTETIAESLRTNGQFRPLVVNKGTHTGRPYEVLAGNHTLLAARTLDGTQDAFPRLDCYVIDVDDDHARRIVLADNRTSDLASYDDVALLDLLEAADDLDGTGYEEDDLADLMAAIESEEAWGPGQGGAWGGEADTDSGDNDRPSQTPRPDVPALTDEDDAPEVVEGESSIAQPGDLFELGDHLVLCGDSTDQDLVLSYLMKDGRADVIWTDPPYGVSYVGKTKDALTIQNDEENSLGELLGAAFPVMSAAARPGAPVYMAHPAGELSKVFQDEWINAGLLWRQTLIWAKNTFALGRSDYHYKHEPIMYGFTPGGEGRLGRGGDRWYGDNSQTTLFEVDKPSRNAEHPTMKPVELILLMLDNSLPRGGIVFDPFGGSGSTLIAAHHHGSRARIVELDPSYVDVICRRFQEHTGIVPKRSGVEVDFMVVSDD